MRKLLCPLIGGLVLCLMGYAAWLTSDLGSVFACAPAVLVIVAVVVGLVGGVSYFGTSEVVAIALPVPGVGLPRIPRSRAPSQDARPIYNERKIRGVMVGLGEIPAKHTRKRRRPSEVAQVLEQACTGCGVCIPFCPTDCIESEAQAQWPERRTPPVRVRYDECIGCGICVGVCGTLAWDATVMRSTEDIELEEGVRIHDAFPVLDDRSSGF